MLIHCFTWFAVGSKAAVEAARKHPLMRALRPDKLTIAALAATLGLYRKHALSEIPTQRMLGATADALRTAATALAAAIGSVAGVAIAVEPTSSTVGGGAMPLAQLASWAVTLSADDVERLDRELRQAAAPVVGKIEDGKLWLDVRTVAADELADVAAAVQTLAG